MARTLKAVVQQETTGCAIASAAAIAGLSYGQARKVANGLGIFASDPTLWSDSRHMRKLLRALGVRAGSREEPFRSWMALPDCALLAIKWHLEDGKPYWHWTVFVRESGRACVLDSGKSLKRNRRTDFGRIQPKWFIRIQRKQAG